MAGVSCLSLLGPCLGLLLVVASSTTVGRSSTFATAFTVSGGLSTRHARRHPPSRLHVIEPDTVDFEFNVRQGGVQLAEESVIKLEGKLVRDTSNNSLEPTLTNLVRYTRLVAVDEALVQAVLTKLGATIIATGSGQELYQDPGTSTEQTIRYGPVEAVRSAVQSSLTTSAERVCISFCGGNDAQVLEVLAALRDVSSSLPSSATATFTSISHDTFALGSSTVTILTMNKQSTADGPASTEEASVYQAIANGDLYVANGRYYTLLEQDINPALA